MLPLTAIGTPANGARSPGTTSSAASKAFSAATSMKALMAGSSASMRRRAASTTSRGLASPERTSAAVSSAETNARSSTRPGTLAVTLRAAMALERLITATTGLATPSLVVDLPAADRNIAAANVRLRPHLKAHKCPELMRRQLAGGDCSGVTCATAWEAEIAARAGLHDDILVANEVADPGGLASLRRAAERARVTVAIDSPRHLELLDGIDCRVLIEINVGQDRCGLDPGGEAAIVALAERAGERFRGLQGYEGHAVLLAERPSREHQVERAATILNGLRGLLECELVSGGGTGTFDLSTH